MHQNMWTTLLYFQKYKGIGCAQVACLQMVRERNGSLLMEAVNTEDKIRNTQQTKNR